MTGLLLTLALLTVPPTYYWGKHRGLARHHCRYIPNPKDLPPQRTVALRCSCGTDIAAEVTGAEIYQHPRTGIKEYIGVLDLTDWHAHRWTHEGAKA